MFEIFFFLRYDDILNNSNKLRNMLVSILNMYLYICI